MPLKLKDMDTEKKTRLCRLRREIADLAMELRGECSELAVDESPELDSNFRLERFLVVFDFDSDSLTLQERATLDFLSRRVEVRRELYRCYAPPDPKPLTKNVASGTEVQLLLLCFLDRFIISGDWRFMNTVLKALDGILLAPVVEFGSRLRYIAARCLTEMAKGV